MRVQKLSVSNLISLIKKNLENSFGQVYVSGEVSNLTYSPTGHWYFSLKDKSSLINAALFKMDALRNPVIKKIKNGQQLSIHGQISVYPPRGSFQLIAKQIFVEGEGSLQVKFEKLKSKLRSEGLFDVDQKQPIPKFPRRIAVITSLKAAALQDFLKIVKRRMIWGDFVIIDSLVQGEKAPKNLIKAIDKAEKTESFDLIILTRGGGSLEDLWAFNDEELARRISSSNIPTISAIGHEVDYTLIDYVSDLRCETPSAAAEVISEPQVRIKNKLEYLKSELKSKMHVLGLELNSIQREANPKKLLIHLKDNFNLGQRRLGSLNPIQYEKELNYNYNLQLIEDFNSQIEISLNNKLSEASQKLSQVEGFIKGIDPKKVLNRGYCYLKGNNVLSSAKSFDLDNSVKMKLVFSDGVRNVYKQN